MSDFLKEAMNEKRLKAESALLGKLGYIYVEGLADILFWKKMLDDKYIIHIGTKEATRSKTVLMKLLPFANKFGLIAIDSDHDFVCKNHRNESIAFNACEYTLQTYVYSKESVMSSCEIIENTISKIDINNEKINSCYSDYISDYSSIIYDQLVLYLLIKENKSKKANDEWFHNKITPKTPLFDRFFSLKNDPFIEIKKSKENHLHELKEEIKTLGITDENIEDFKLLLEQIGLTKNTSAFFINGHVLQDSIVIPFINSNIRALKTKLLISIKIECEKDKEMIEQRRNEVNNYINDNFNFKTLLQLDEKITNNWMSEKILGQLHSIQ